MKGNYMKIFTISELIGTMKQFPLLQKVSPVEAVKSLTFFKDVPEAVLQEIVDGIFIHQYAKDEIISRHGRYNEWLYVVLSGEISVFIITPDYTKLELYALGPEDFFGEDIVIRNEPRESTAIAFTDSILLAIGKQELTKIIASSAATYEKLNNAFLQRKMRNNLRSIPIFTHLREEVFNEILDVVRLVHVKKGDVIFKQGDVGDALFLIRKGDVSVYRAMNKNEELISLLAEGNFFGEMALVLGEPRNATVIANDDCELLKIDKNDFDSIIARHVDVYNTIQAVALERVTGHELFDSNEAFISKKLIELNRAINKHIDVIAQCTFETPKGSALLATLPGSRYPYVYPRDSACATRMLYRIAMSRLRSKDIAFRLLAGIAKFIYNCQRDDGYWGQRYGLDAADKSIYKQEDNVAHGVSILCRYLLAAKNRGHIPHDNEAYIEAIYKGAMFAVKRYYRNEIHLFYSTTSIHESAIEEGYSIWVNYAYYCMLLLIEQVAKEFNCETKFEKAFVLKEGFGTIVKNVFTIGDRLIRRLKPDGEADLRPDITLMSPFFFGTGIVPDIFKADEIFINTMKFLEDTLWDPDLGMLQRYLPFIEDPNTHVHAGNGPWVQYTAMLAQYYYFTGNVEKGDTIMDIIDSYSTDGYLCEHLTTPDRFHEFMTLEWLPGSDVNKEFAPDIMVDGITYDLIVEELNHMKNSYDQIKRRIETGSVRYLTFAIPLMWSHAEYAMALLLKTWRQLQDTGVKQHIL